MPRLFIYCTCFLLLLCGLVGCSKGNTVTPSPNAGDSTVTSPLTITLRAKLPTLLKESSGLCYTAGALWSFGDGGNPNWLWRIDTASGAILQTVVIGNFGNTDWEDITADSAFIYIGDFGNNDGNRKDLHILKISKADIPDTGSLATVNAEAIYFSFADQVSFAVNSNTNFDCEAMTAIGDSLYLFTKDAADLRTRCYKLPKQPGNYAVSPFLSYNTAGKVTAAAYDAQRHVLALLGYMNKKLGAFIWFFSDFTTDNFFSGKATRINIGDGTNAWQTEGLDFVTSSQLFISSEASNSVPACLYKISFYP